MSFDKQFEQLFAILNESQYLIDSPFKKVIEQAVQGSGFCSQQPKTSKAIGYKAKGSKGKKSSGYNLFLSAAMKGEIYDAKQSMTEAVSLWQNLTMDEKNHWNDKAKEKNAQNITSSGDEVVIKKATKKKTEKGKRPMSGYNLFTKVKMAELKENKEIEAKDRLKEIGKQWKELTKEESYFTA